MSDVTIPNQRFSNLHRNFILTFLQVCSSEYDFPRSGTLFRFVPSSCFLYYCNLHPLLPVKFIFFPIRFLQLHTIALTNEYHLKQTPACRLCTQYILQLTCNDSSKHTDISSKTDSWYLWLSSVCLVSITPTLYTKLYSTCM